MEVINNKENDALEKLITYSAYNQLCIVTATKQRAELIKAKAKEMKLYIPFPITLPELTRGADNKLIIREVLVDDIDVVTKYLFRAVFKDLEIKKATANCLYLNKLL